MKERDNPPARGQRWRGIGQGGEAGRVNRREAARTLLIRPFIGAKWSHDWISICSIMAAITGHSGCKITAFNEVEVGKEAQL